VPLILLVEAAEEPLAIEAVKEGAFDYVLEPTPGRLAGAVHRAAREVQTRQELRSAHERLESSEAHTRQLNATWEERLKERTASLEAAMKELEAFSYSVSHDLRAPLRGIDGFARALKEECGPALGAEGLRLLQVIRDQARRMTQLIDDLLAFSRAGRQQIDRSGTDMTELARSAFQTIVEALPSPAPALTLSALPVADGDRSMLRQVFANLLGNAVKFSSRQPAPHIQISGWTEDQMNIYCIRDNGVGFDPRYVHKLFGVFQRLHSVDEFEGTGVGLALVQRIVQRHGGRVWAEGKPKEGAAFYFTLPVRAVTR
jgi:light-regulated signal transduction histidine kinase (bacteriophytochrome)